MGDEYQIKGIIHAGVMNPWKVNSEGVFEKATEELNKLAEQGWEVITAYSAGNGDRGIYVLRKKSR